MNTLTARPSVNPQPKTPTRSPRHTAIGSGRFGRRGNWMSRHLRSLLWLSPVLLVAGVVQTVNIAGTPRRIDDEGTYVAQAWAIVNLGELTHYTYWYDHPPLGWIQIAIYAQLTDAFDRWDTAVLAGREAMIVALLISAILLWMLCRRTGFTRMTAAVATLIFSISPLAVQFHRYVYLDNIAVPWLLAAFLLAMSPKRQLGGFAASAAAFGVSVLTKETFLLALPFLIWTMAQHASPHTRRYTMSVAGSVLVLIGASYILFAAIKGEVLPGENRVSLFSGVMFQLVSRTPGGSIFDPTSTSHDTVSLWLRLDPVILVAGTAAAVAALLIPRLRPIAALSVFHLVFMLRPGSYLPDPYVIVLLPFLALLLAGIGESALEGLKGLKGPKYRTTTRDVMSAVVVMGLGFATVAAVPAWSAGLHKLTSADEDASSIQAQRWVERNVPRNNRIIVEDSMWVDLVDAGFPRDNVLWHYKLDTDAEVAQKSPEGWRDSDYIVRTATMVQTEDLEEVTNAVENSVVVASFGNDLDLVEVRRIYPQGLTDRQQQLQDSEQINASIGAALLEQPGLELTPEVRARLLEGHADPRILLALQTKLTTSSVGVAELPVVEGEDGTQPRQMLVSSLNGSPALPGTPAANDVVAWMQELPNPLQPSGVEQTSEGVLVTLPVLAPPYVTAE